MKIRELLVSCSSFLSMKWHVDGAPKVVKEQASKEEAEEIKKKLEEVGAKVTLK